MHKPYISVLVFVIFNLPLNLDQLGLQNKVPILVIFLKFQLLALSLVARSHLA